MNVVYGYENETYIFDMELNEQGFVSYCEETEPDGNLETWDFGYTADGHLNYMKRSEGGNEVTNITYANGNIVKASMVSEEEPNRVSVYTLFYTSDEVTEPVENKGSIMLFDELFNIDMDEMKYAYYAGLLGKATKDLPVKNTTTITGDAYRDEEFTDVEPRSGHQCHIRIVVMHIEPEIPAVALLGVRQSEHRPAEQPECRNVEPDNHRQFKPLDRYLHIAVAFATDPVGIVMRSELQFGRNLKEFRDRQPRHQGDLIAGRILPARNAAPLQRDLIETRIGNIHTSAYADTQHLRRGRTKCRQHQTQCRKKSSHNRKI